MDTVSNRLKIWLIDNHYDKTNHEFGLGRMNDYYYISVPVRKFNEFTGVLGLHFYDDGSVSLVSKKSTRKFA